MTSPSLPTLPTLDTDVQRGKRTIQLDLDNPSDADKLLELVKEADVFLQSYRPAALAARGFSTAELVKLNPGIIIANLSAWGTEGPWKEARGFDSLVQNATGLNVSEAEHYGEGSPAKALPMQARDHASGYLLATAVSTALYKRANEGGTWQVNVSLAGVGKYLRSLGQIEIDIAHPHSPTALGRVHPQIKREAEGFQEEVYFMLNTGNIDKKGDSSLAHNIWNAWLDGMRSAEIARVKHLAFCTNHFVVKVHLLSQKDVDLTGIWFEFEVSQPRDEELRKEMVTALRELANSGAEMVEGSCRDKLSKLADAVLRFDEHGGKRFESVCRKTSALDNLKEAMNYR